MHYQKEKFKKNPIYNCIKRIKYLEINLTKVKDLYTENNKALRKGIEEDK